MKIYNGEFNTNYLSMEEEDEQDWRDVFGSLIWNEFI